MAIMGWTQLATAQRYTHAVDDLRRRAATTTGDMLWETHLSLPVDSFRCTAARIARCRGGVSCGEFSNPVSA